MHLRIGATLNWKELTRSLVNKCPCVIKKSEHCLGCNVVQEALLRLFSTGKSSFGLSWVCKPFHICITVVVHRLPYQSLSTSDPWVSGRSYCTSPDWTINLGFFSAIFSLNLTLQMSLQFRVFTCSSALNWKLWSLGCKDTCTGLVWSCQWSRRFGLECEPIKPNNIKLCTHHLKLQIESHLIPS